MADASKARNLFARKACTIDGCGSIADARGMCKLHYNRWKRNGDPLKGRSKEGEALRFVEFAKSYTGSKCLIWPYATTRGYACVRIEGKAHYVSRMICEAENGPPPFANAHALHSCDRGAEGCISPHHLRWGTQKDNVDDMLSRGRSVRGRKHGPQSPATIAKRSSSLRGRVVSPETRAKISAALLRRARNADVTYP